MNKPSISKELFIETIDVIERQMAYDSKCTEAFSQILPNDSVFFGYDNHLLHNQLLKMLKAATNDQCEIQYFIDELDFGRLWTPTSISDENGKMVKMKNVNQLWSVLCKNFKSK